MLAKEILKYFYFQNKKNKALFYILKFENEN